MADVPDCQKVKEEPGVGPKKFNFCSHLKLLAMKCEFLVHAVLDFKNVAVIESPSEQKIQLSLFHSHFYFWLHEP